MRATPAMIVLALLTAVVLGGSWLVGREAAAPADAAEAAATQPTRDVPELQLPDPLPVRTLTVPILAYQRVAVVTGEEDPELRRRTVEAQEFQLQLEWLRDGGYEAITMPQLYRALIEGAELPERPVVLAFLGGYRGIATVAAPRLREAEMHGVVCAIGERLPRRRAAARDRLTWGMLRELEASGWDVASEGMSGEALAGLSEERMRTDLADGQAKLERILGHPVQWLCGPDGRTDAALAATARQLGFVLGFGIGEGVDQSASVPLQLTAIAIDNETDVRDLATLLGG